MAESIFEAVKQSVTVREAAQMYGIEVNRRGMACCPFHDDKNPSMKLNEDYFFCFGCGATGDVIDFTARLYNLSPKEAAEKLAQDFGLAYDSQAPPRRRYVRQKTEAQKFKEDRDHTFRVQMCIRDSQVAVLAGGGPDHGGQTLGNGRFLSDHQLHCFSSSFPAAMRSAAGGRIPRLSLIHI